MDRTAYHRVGARPLDLPVGRTVVYAGTVHPDRMDFELTLRTAEALAGLARLVLIGPLLVDAALARRLERAAVVTLGARPADTLPAYLRHADVLVVPHAVTPFTESLDPIKRYEYQAAARPVVATPVAGFTEPGLPRVTVAAPPDFPAAVVAALGATSAVRVGRPAQVDHTAPDWSDRVSAIRAVLARLAPSAGATVPAERHPRPRVAIAHDYLTQRGGAERVVLAMARAFPDATVYTTLYDPQGTYPEFAELDIVVSPINRSRWLRRHHRAALPFMPLASLTVKPDADVVIASSSGFAHGFRADGRRLVYCHAPARWLYQSDAYIGASPLFTLARPLLWLLGPSWRWWDRRAAARASRYLANSRVVRDRVRAAYGIEAQVLPPPLVIDPAGPREVAPEVADWAADGFHLVVARLLPYKNVEVVVEAFARMPARRLVVVGDGPHAAALEARLPGNVRLVRSLTDAQLRWIYAHTIALVAASIEDFGLTPLEAGAFGKPTIALEAGGYLDTVVPGVTGVFFAEPVVADIVAAVGQAEAVSWSEQVIALHAASFSEARFAEALRAEVATLCGEVAPAPSVTA